MSKVSNEEQNNNANVILSTVTTIAVALVVGELVRLLLVGAVMLSFFSLFFVRRVHFFSLIFNDLR